MFDIVLKNYGLLQRDPRSDTNACARYTPIFYLDTPAVSAFDHIATSERSFIRFKTRSSPALAATVSCRDPVLPRTGRKAVYTPAVSGNIIARNTIRCRRGVSFENSGSREKIPPPFRDFFSRARFSSARNKRPRYGDDRGNMTFRVSSRAPRVKCLAPECH